MPFSSIGWGHNPFGNHQFGFGDWAEEMLWKNISEVYRDCDEAGPTGSTVAQPLRKFQSALKPSYQDIRIKWHQFPSLWDAITVPLAQLPQLGYNVGITVDSTKDEGLQRSSVLNASQLWVNKGTDKGYELTAAFEGLLVTITPLWAKTCGPARHELGVIGDAAASFDLSTTQLTPRPVGPGTLHIQVTTEFGTVEDVYDDEVGGLTGSSNRLNGPLSRLDITNTLTLNINTIVGVFNDGDLITQGATTGTVVAWGGSTLNVVVTAGAFIPGPILDTITGGTATVTTTSSDILSRGEVVVGASSGTTAAMRDFNSAFMIVDRISSLAGFTPGETLRGQTSGAYAIAGTTTELLEGPLQARLTITPTFGTLTAGSEITGGVSGAIGFVRTVISPATLYVDTTTTPGFSIGETVSDGVNTATVDAISFGSIDYIAGAMTGSTVSLAPGSAVDAVVDLQTTGADQFLPAYDAISADLLAMDDVQTDRYAEWPRTYFPVRISGGILTPGECRSYSLRLYFYPPDDTEIEDFVDVARRIELALEQFRPIHVRFDKISFDGARASSQVWRTGQIIADSAAAAVWTASVTGLQLASSQVWTTGPFSATVAT